MYYEQEDYDIRLEWGEKGVDVLAPSSDVVIIVDVLSFTTCVEIALTRGATVFPFRGTMQAAQELAHEKEAMLAARRGTPGATYTLSPESLLTVPDGTRLILPSPNGSTLSLAAARHATTVAGCLRNSSAVAAYAQARFERITIIPCGERWWPEGKLRPSLEDLVGAGAIIHALRGKKSPEALQAELLYRALTDLPATVAACVSGVELREKGFAEDVRLATAVNVSECVPLLESGRYVRVAGQQ